MPKTIPEQNNSDTLLHKTLLSHMKNAPPSTSFKKRHIDMKMAYARQAIGAVTLQRFRTGRPAKTTRSVATLLAK
jgi:hypothetical protein